MTKKPITVGPTDEIKTLDALARKIMKLLDDNEAWLGSYQADEGQIVSVVYLGTSPDGDSDRPAKGTVAVTVTDDPHILVQR